MAATVFSETFTEDGAMQGLALRNEEYVRRLNVTDWKWLRVIMLAQIEFTGANLTSPLLRLGAIHCDPTDIQDTKTFLDSPADHLLYLQHGGTVLDVGTTGTLFNSGASSTYFIQDRAVGLIESGVRRSVAIASASSDINFVTSESAPSKRKNVFMFDVVKNYPAAGNCLLGGLVTNGSWRLANHLYRHMKDVARSENLPPVANNISLPTNATYTTFGNGSVQYSTAFTGFDEGTYGVLDGIYVYFDSNQADLRIFQLEAYKLL